MKLALVSYGILVAVIAGVVFQLDRVAARLWRKRPRSLRQLLDAFDDLGGWRE